MTLSGWRMTHPPSQERGAWGAVNTIMVSEHPTKGPGQEHVLSPRRLLFLGPSVDRVARPNTPAESCCRSIMAASWLTDKAKATLFALLLPLGGPFVNSFSPVCFRFRTVRGALVTLPRGAAAGKVAMLARQTASQYSSLPVVVCWTPRSDQMHCAVRGGREDEPEAMGEI